MTRNSFRLIACTAALTLTPALPSLAQQPQVASPVPVTAAASGFERFTPRPAKRTSFDYGVWDDALDDMVLDLGPSLRRRAGRPTAQVGTRIAKGHSSAYRLEGSRFTFAYVNDTYREGLEQYRKDLEELGTRYDIATLSRDEQLAYWINLHNVALIEKIAEGYPIRRPSRINVKVDGTKHPIDEAPFITVKGQRLSLRDIRTRIVYPNWNDPRVTYAFFRGDIGGPRLAPNAFTASRLDYMLDENAREFVNSLRGFNLARDSRKVSKIYEEVAPFYFPSLERDLIRHMSLYARPEVAQEMAEPRPVEYDRYEDDVADLSGGNRLGASALNTASTRVNGVGVSFEVAQLLRETNEKFRELRSEGLVGGAQGTVIIEDIETEDLTPDPEYSPYYVPPAGE